MAQSDSSIVDPNESGAEREVRIQNLFKQLDVNGRGYLDRDALKKGFKRINHPLQNAESFIDNVMKAADFNDDGIIEVSYLSSSPGGANGASGTNLRHLSLRRNANCGDYLIG